MTDTDTAEPAEDNPSHAKAKVVTDKAGGIERYTCSAGDFVTYADTDTVRAHIASEQSSPIANGGHSD